MNRCTHTYDGDAYMKVNGSMLECVDGCTKEERGDM
jgi:hypothetical protein